jgi:hypothetical protein
MFTAAPGRLSKFQNAMPASRGYRACHKCDGKTHELIDVLYGLAAGFDLPKFSNYLNRKIGPEL